MTALFDVSAYDHVGIRVSDRNSVLEFYERLGFRVGIVDDKGAMELINESGLRINLIPNGEPQSAAHNILLDAAVKYPGITHAAFVVPSLDEAVAAVTSAGIRITEGPKETERRRYFFIRDPDGNVLEFNELKNSTK